MTDPLWYKDAILYELHVKSFFDSNNDGIGDFRGVLDKLDYLKDLGITALWLLPFYPSPLRDDGYDIADYKGINPSYGTMRDFRALVRAAHERGLKVITELVINHTSDQHPWFQRARTAKRGSAWRDFYIWSDDDRKWPETRIIFNDTESSNWTWDPVAGQYYWHRFFSHQPDLNFDNPKVVRAVVEIMRYWLDMGVDGLRLDAIPYLVERDGTNNENLPETHAILKQLRAALDESHPHAFFLAEANQWPEDTLPYFGDGDECHMSFHFPLMPRIFMALAQEDRHPVTDILRQTPEIPENCQWAVFLRNHDELTLEMVTDKERDYLWHTYAADRRMRINMGIRRRLSPLMDGDRRKIELLNSLLFSMPGTPIIYYGDEIGMGDNIFLGDRDGVRTPMQWSPDRNGGFSKADPARLFLPAIMDPIYGYPGVNVEAQQRSAASLLNWMRRIMTVRQQHQCFGRGDFTLIYPGNRKILAYLREHEGETILCVANLSRQAQAVELDLSRFRGRVPVELLGRSPFPPIGELPYLLTLPAFGFYWFLLAEEAAVPVWHEAPPEPLPDFVTLIARDGWHGLTTGRVGRELTRDVLPPFIANQRWFGAKDHRIADSRLIDAIPLEGEHGAVLAALVDVDLRGWGPGNGGDRQAYFLPLAVHWDEAAVTTPSTLLPYALAKVRRERHLGALIDGTADPAYARAALALIRDQRSLAGDAGSLRCTASPSLAGMALDPAAEVQRLSLEQSNSSLLIGESLVLKTYRRLAPGLHPEIEIGRFLTDVAGFPHVPPLLGAIEHVAQDGTPTALAVLQGYIRNQGDGWAWTLDYLARELEELHLGIGDPDVTPADRHGLYLATARTLGIRIAELHRALALTTGDPAFDPQPAGPADRDRLHDAVLNQAASAFGSLREVLPGLEGGRRQTAGALLEREAEALALVDRLAALDDLGALTRHHGDLHLGQMLFDRGDVIFVDFEGEPARPLTERRAKKPPLRDVAGMVRSFDYAAWAASFRLSEEAPETLDGVLEHARIWADLAVDTFLDAYFAVALGTAPPAAEGGGDRTAMPGLPSDPATARQLLDLLVLEKALYEISYEAANRPSWLVIPVRGVLALLDAHGAAKEGAE